MALSRTVGGKILIEEAKALTEAYQGNFPDEPKCYFVGAEHIEDILAHSGCVGIRIYKGLDKTTDKKTLVMIGVDANGKDLTDGPIVDRMKMCPDECDSSSSLVF